jgi:MtN3 and saliva related transmembrane protein
MLPVSTDCGAPSLQAGALQKKRSHPQERKAPFHLPHAGGGRIQQAATHLMNWTSAIGLIAAFCTTVSYIPQLKKCWQTESAGDLSLKTFTVLATGVALWVLYGVLQNDSIIILANAVSLSFLLGILYFKLREGWRH